MQEEGAVGAVSTEAAAPLARLSAAGGVPLLLAWLLAMRFSSAPFPAEVPVAASSAMSVGALVAVASGLLLSFAFGGADVCGRVSSGVARALCAGLACASTLLPHVALALAGPSGAWPEGFPVVAVYAVSGVLLGGVLLFVLGDVLGELLRVGFEGLVLGTAVSLASGASLFCVLCAALPARSGWAVCVLPVAFALAGRGAPASRGDVPAPGAPSPEGGGTAFDAALALVGFIAAYMPTMYPKTTNLPVYSLPPGSCLGLTSWRSVGSVFLLLGILALLRYVFDRRRRGATVGVASVVSLFAAIFFSLPSMSTSPVPFMLMTPASLALALVLLASLCRLGRREVLRGLVLMAAGALCAGVFSAVFLGPMYGVFELQDWLFNLTPAVLLVVVSVLALSNEGRLAGLLFPTSDAESSRVVGTLDQRCAEVSARYSLTARESQVLALVAEGRNEPYVEKALSISRATVKTHVTHIYRKVGVASRQELLDVILG